MADEKAGSFHYGGQAVIEGVMMRGKKHFAVACRRLDGSIESTAEPIEGTILGRLKWLNKPFLRGTLMLVDSLFLGMKSLMWAANLAMADEEAKNPPKKAKKAAPKPVEAVDCPPGDVECEERAVKGSKVTEIALGATMFISLGLAVVIFMMLPALITKLALPGENTATIWRGMLEGGIKLAFLFLYIWGISHWKDIRRVFEYHGAEHKVINAFEAGEELTPPNVQKHTTVHVRCGTSFLLVVIFVSIIVFMAISWDSWLIRVAYKLVLLPFVAGIAYEIIKFAGNRKDSWFMKLLLGPGLLMQRITTQQPSDEQVEVAIKSFQCVREMEEEAVSH